eukprot:m.71700 g.71700  ORF g.71700 m.71700 type:complete len:575 (-) comp8731_c0_seq2:571-2295(-)
MNYVKIAPVQKTTGPKAGQLIVTITGPAASRVNAKSGKKVLFARDLATARAAASRFCGGETNYTLLSALDVAPTRQVVKRRSEARPFTETGYGVAKAARVDLPIAAGAVAAGPAPPEGELPPVERHQLTQRQCAIADRVLAGQNAFITGAAGTGKSFLFRYIRTQLEQRLGGAVAVTAPTGVAAINVGGVTIHSWAGVGLARGTVEDVCAKVMGNAKACASWRRTKVLMIDEISMLGGRLLTMLAKIGATVRGQSVPFGGIQVITCGDFFQLPPVGLDKFGETYGFEAPAWSQLAMRTEILTEVIRQAGDAKFTALLNEVRLGNLSKESTRLLASCHVSVKPPPADGIVPTKVMCINQKVDQVNSERLALLPTPMVELQSVDVAHREGDVAGAAKKLEDAMGKRVPELLQLKLGAQVVLLKNLDVDQQLMNGSRGVVAGFDNVALTTLPERVQRFFIAGGRGLTITCPSVRFDCGVTRTILPHDHFQSSGSLGAMIRIQVPLRLAWAITVHKSQGMTLSRAEVEVSDAFDSGQVYVALSRCVSLKGLWISGPPLTKNAVKADARVRRFYGMGAV